MALPLFVWIIVAVLVTSIIFWLKTFIGAVLFGVLDAVVGIALLSVPSSGKLILLGPGIPAQVTLYIGAALVLKGVYSVISGFR